MKPIIYKKGFINVLQHGIVVHVSLYEIVQQVDFIY